jgi:hypothetical protein
VFVGTERSEDSFSIRPYHHHNRAGSHTSNPTEFHNDSGAAPGNRRLLLIGGGERARAQQIRVRGKGGGAYRCANDSLHAAGIGERGGRLSPSAAAESWRKRRFGLSRPQGWVEGYICLLWWSRFVWRGQRVEAGSESDPAVGNLFLKKKSIFKIV